MVLNFVAKLKDIDAQLTRKSTRSPLYHNFNTDEFNKLARSPISPLGVELKSPTSGINTKQSTVLSESLIQPVIPSAVVGAQDDEQDAFIGEASSSEPAATTSEQDQTNNNNDNNNNSTMTGDETGEQSDEQETDDSQPATETEEDEESAESTDDVEEIPPCTLSDCSDLLKPIELQQPSPGQSSGNGLTIEPIVANAATNSPYNHHHFQPNLMRNPPYPSGFKLPVGEYQPINPGVALSPPNTIHPPFLYVQPDERISSSSSASSQFHFLPSAVTLISSCLGSLLLLFYCSLGTSTIRLRPSSTAHC